MLNYKTNDGISDRFMNEEEISQYEKLNAEIIKKAEEEKKRIEAKTVLLQKLGITEEEAKLLLG